MPGGRGALFRRASSAAPRRSATRAAIESVVASQVCGRGSGRSASAFEEPARGEDRDATRVPGRGEVVRTLDHLEAGHQARQQPRGQVERTKRQVVRSILPQPVDPIEVADEVGRPAPADDHDQAPGASGLPVGGEPVAEARPGQAGCRPP